MEVTITQGPRAGAIHPGESVKYTDSRTGVDVIRLTSSRSHDHHLYFTSNSWFDADQKLLFGSDRTGSPNLFAVDVSTTQIRQLTDLPYSGDSQLRGTAFPFQFASLNPMALEVYFWWDGHLCALDIETCSLRTLYELPPNYIGDITDVSADGKYICTSVYQDVTHDIPADLGITPFRRAGPGFEQVWKNRPQSKVIAVPVEGGDPICYHETNYWIAHVNTSPTRPELLTFAHYGPWTEVDHRIWCCNRDTHEVWKVRTESVNGTPSPPTVHEYWLADGNRLGYYGLNDKQQPVYGIINYDDSKQQEWPIHHQPVDMLPHFHSRDNLLIGDGNDEYPFLTVWEMTDGFAGPRDLVFHGTSRDVQVTHAHPRLSMAGDRVVFTSNRTGYANVYLANIPDFSDLDESDIEP